jgi:hypothetical protein
VYIVRKYQVLASGNVLSCQRNQEKTHEASYFTFGVQCKVDVVTANVMLRRVEEDGIVRFVLNSQTSTQNKTSRLISS